MKTICTVRQLPNTLFLPPFDKPMIKNFTKESKKMHQKYLQSKKIKMKTTIFENLEFKNNKSIKAQYLYKLMPENWGKRIKKFAVNKEIGIYAMNCINSNYYWANGMTGNGNWACGGFFPFPICANASDIVIDCKTGEAWKFVKKLK